MYLTKFAVVLVLLTARACRANIVLETSRPSELTTRFVEDLVNIVTACYGDGIKGIGLGGNLPDILIKTLSVRNVIPIVVIGSPYQEPDSREQMFIQFRRYLKHFIVKAPTFNQLDLLIELNIRFTVWWNHMASFIILDMSPDCRDASDFLYLAWQRKIINAKVLCYRNGTTVVFNFNPYTNHAPISWQPVNVFPGIKKHPFTVFARKYRRNKNICEELDFEKRQNLGGHEIFVQGIGARAIKRTTSTRGIHEFMSRNNRVFDTLSDILNATVKYSGGRSQRVLKEANIVERPNSIFNTWKLTPTSYPHMQIGYTIVSHFRGHQSQLSKILSVLDDYSRYGMIIVYMISFMFFKFFIRQRLVPALLNLVRITCNTGFANLPSNTASRIYLGCLLFFAVTLQGIFMGKLASILTTITPLPNVNTIQDAELFDYNICIAQPQMVEYFNLKKYFVIDDDIDACIMKVVNDPSVAYLGFGEGSVFDIARTFKLHLSRELIIPCYIIYKVQCNYALEERINVIIQRLVEADVLNPWDSHCDPIKLSDFEFDDAVKNNQIFKNIELGELGFAFGILGIGLTCATITLIIELATQYKCKCWVSFERR